MIDNWPKAKLKNFVKKIGSGITPKGGAATYTNEGIQFIRSQNVLENRLDLTDVVFINEKQHKRMSSSIVKPNDVLLNITGASIGRSCTVPSFVKEANVNQHVCIIRLKDEINPSFLSTYLNSWFGQKQIWSFQGGGSREGLNYQQIGGFDIPIVPRKEQDAIADLLSTWDASIEKAERLIAAKEKRLFSYGQQLFDPKDGIKKIGWAKVRLSTILSEHGELSTGIEEVFSVSVHKGIVNQIEHLGRSFSANDTSKYNRVHYGDIVYTKSPTGNFPYGIVKQNTVIEDVIVSPLYGVFTPKTTELGTILDFYFESPMNARNYLHPIIQKGAKNTINITNKIFLSAKLHLPLLPNEQKIIAEFLNTARQEINLLKKKATAYRKQKRGLMQKLLTGEWQIKTILKEAK